MRQPVAGRAARARAQQVRLSDADAAGAAGRALRNDGQRQRLAERHAIRRLAEIDQAGGADALDVAAERHDVEIGLEQLALRIARLEPERGADLAQLAGRRLRVQAIRAAAPAAS